jgi:hypothetical protein
VAERAAYQESAWLPQFTLIGDESDVQDVVRAIAKVAANLETLAKANPNLAGKKAQSRATRAVLERQKNY